MKDNSSLTSKINPSSLLFLESFDDGSQQSEFSQLFPESSPNHQQIQQKFIELGKTNFQSAVTPTTDLSFEAKQLKVLQLINAYRINGHFAANLNPLHHAKSPATQAFDLVDYGLTEADLDLKFSSGSFRGINRVSLREIIAAAQKTYCGTLGVEYMHIANLEEKRWIQERIEPKQSQPQIHNEQKQWLLQRLIAAEVFEQFLHTKYVGQKRFSLEGGESLIPLLNILIDNAGEHQIKRVDLGMAHRGRLNVLINIFGKRAENLFKEFAGDFSLSANQTGDVKYHLGFSSDIKTNQQDIHLSLAFNPSHLELVNPVVIGHCRYLQEVLESEGAKREQILPVLIHGDAAIAGQGIIMETLNLSQAKGYTTAGTLHIVINNQIGFTTSNHNDARSTYYCTDIMKVIDAPIFHVNAEDPEMLMFVCKLALDYRMFYKKDVVIDLVCYRRHGHNEADEPSVTQPIMYKIIRSMPTTSSNYTTKLIAEQVINQSQVEALITDYRSRLKNGERVAYNIIDPEKITTSKDIWQPYLNARWGAPYKSSLSKTKIVALNQKLQQLPAGFKLHKIVAKTMAERNKMAKGEINIDWGFAETMAYASLADNGTSIRLSGQDSGRGTFFHRHAILHNQNQISSYIPLQHLHKNQGRVQIIDSVLSEEAVLGFEFGYATANPDSLVIWEAQFGDFANGAQAIIDQFITTAEAKWARLSNLVMMLPHGLEGQGPEHSSAKIERFLQSCARYNIQVCVPSSASQIFHLLRRQIIRKFRKPLIIFTPKGLLRNKLAASPLAKFTGVSKFQIVIGEQYPEIKPNKVTRVVICSGKVFYELLTRRQNGQINNVALLRLEQIYPFSHDSLGAELVKFPNAKEVVWCQEEPINQGVWYTNRHNFAKCVTKKQDLLLVARDLSAVAAEGSLGLHNINQNRLIEQALGIKAIST